MRNHKYFKYYRTIPMQLMYADFVKEHLGFSIFIKKQKKNCARKIVKYLSGSFGIWFYYIKYTNKAMPSNFPIFCHYQFKICIVHNKENLVDVLDMVMFANVFGNALIYICTIHHRRIQTSCSQISSYNKHFLKCWSV